MASLPGGRSGVLDRHDGWLEPSEDCGDQSVVRWQRYEVSARGGRLVMISG